MVILDRDGLDAVLRRLTADGYRVLGPTVRDDAVVIDEIASTADLPRGVRDEADPGHYRLHDDGGDVLFGTRVGQATWRSIRLPPEATLYRATRGDDGVRIDETGRVPAAAALVGVRPCDVAALAVLDRVLAMGPHTDPAATAARERTFIVAVNCTEPGRTCFCASTGTGPAVREGYDVALTELPGSGPARLVAEAGSERGERLLREVGASPADDATARAAREACRDAAGRMGRSLDVEAARHTLGACAEHRHWRDVGERCLACGNCTAVCPTCFCWTVVDTASLDGVTVERRRRQDSCFSLEFSYVHGGSVRTTRAARYRHWLTHKLATWYEQFGSGGCVGCGRCIVWCPAGIDLTREIAALGVASERPGAVAGAP